MQVIQYQVSSTANGICNVNSRRNQIRRSSDPCMLVTLFCHRSQYGKSLKFLRVQSRHDNNVHAKYRAMGLFCRKKLVMFGR